MATQAENIAKLMANQISIKERVDTIIPYLEAGQEHREKVLSRLAVIESTIDSNIRIYQKDCDDDRDKIHARIKEVELNQAREAGKNSMLSVAISGVMVAIGWAVELWHTR